MKEQNDDIREIAQVDSMPSDRARIAHELHEGEKAERVITVMKPASEVYAYWRNFTNLPKFIKHLDRVDVTSPTRSHWSWRTLGGITVEWDSEVIAEIQDRMISWQTLPGSIVHQAGSVWFKPSPQDGGTEIHVQLRYTVPGGKLAQKIIQKFAEVLGQEPEQALGEDLRRFRWLIEAGEIPTTVGQPHGSRGILH